MLRTLRGGGRIVMSNEVLLRTKHTASSSSWIVGNPKIEDNLNYILRLYEEFIGLREVKLAQAKVLEAETKFKEAQELRMKQQQQMLNIQKSLREIHAELDKTARGEDRYLQLVTKEHSLLKEDRALLAEFRVTEKQEYDHFSMLSFALRESHEKERAQAEKTKYWSIIGSIAGTLIGALASTLTNRYRMQQLREMVTAATSETVKCNELILKVLKNHDERKIKNDSAEEVVLAESSTISVEDAVNSLIIKTNELEHTVTQYSIINAGILSTLLVIVPLMSWLFSR